MRAAHDARNPEEYIVIMATALVEHNVAYLRAHPETAKLVDAPIDPKLRPSNDDAVHDIPSMLRRGYGDAEDHAAWRCAELRMSGADARIVTRLNRERRYYQIGVDPGTGVVEWF
jgi:hypothetical protein